MVDCGWCRETDCGWHPTRLPTPANLAKLLMERLKEEPKEVELGGIKFKLFESKIVPPDEIWMVGGQQRVRLKLSEV